MTFLENVTSGITTIISWIGDVASSLLTAEGDLNSLLPLFTIGIAVSGLLLAIKCIRGLIWGA